MIQALIPIDIDSDSTRWAFHPRLTDEFLELQSKVISILEPLAQETIDKVPYTATYFNVNGDTWTEYDCCDSQECCEKAMADIRGEVDDDAEIEEITYSNDGDHERLDCCYNCGVPLNQQLTWVELELDCIFEDKKDWSKKYFTDYAFQLFCIIEAIPSCDNDISPYSQNLYRNGDLSVLKRRDEFYQSVVELCLEIEKAFEIK